MVKIHIPREFVTRRKKRKHVFFMGDNNTGKNTKRETTTRECSTTYI